MTIRVDKSDRTSFMKKYVIKGTTIENDPLLPTSKSLESYISNYLIHVVTQYDRLDRIAYQYYNNSSYWWLILLGNSFMSENDLKEGMKIKIPSLSEYQTFLDEFID